MLKKMLSFSTLAVAMWAYGVSPAAAEPVLVEQVAPEYPRGAERRDLEGDVTMAFEVNDAGKVENIRVVGESMPGVFNKAAVKALEKWTFEKGNPGEIEVTIAFQL